ncbi:helix-turn-helix transcriptional regulator [Listeria welshimeri]|nr:helix-turn-helix transcriptional regulator [Listeria welshimeri]MBC2276053.1 helix-turn-helix transcriptional regulator [Listeria welshimeri]
MKVIGEAIKRKRTEKRMKMTELAEIVGTSQSAISLIENGKRLPNVNTLKKICSALGINEADYSELLKERERWLNGETRISKFNQDKLRLEPIMSKSNNISDIKTNQFELELLNNVITKFEITNNFADFEITNTLTREIVNQFIRDEIKESILENEHHIRSGIEQKVSRLMKELQNYTS